LASACVMPQAVCRKGQLHYIFLMAFERVATACCMHSIAHHDGVRCTAHINFEVGVGVKALVKLPHLLASLVRPERAPAEVCTGIETMIRKAAADSDVAEQEPMLRAAEACTMCNGTWLLRPGANLLAAARSARMPVAVAGQISRPAEARAKTCRPVFSMQAGGTCCQGGALYRGAGLHKWIVLLCNSSTLYAAKWPHLQCCANGPGVHFSYPAQLVLRLLVLLDVLCEPLPVRCDLRNSVTLSHAPVSASMNPGLARIS
jgi:hypothetical protein